jgi:hypothetical protein
MMRWELTTKSRRMVSMSMPNVEVQSLDGDDQCVDRARRREEVEPYTKWAELGWTGEFACPVLQQKPGWCRWLFPR